MATFPFTNDPLSQVELIYIAYFGRAGDPMGTNFWVNELTASGDTIVPGMTGVAAAFSQQPEAMAQYPLLANPQGASQADIQTFINAIYQNLFDRSADQKGLAFWTNEVNTILATGDPLQIANGIGQMAVSIALGAQGNDQTLLANKVAVSDLLTEIFSEDSINTFPNPSALFTFAHTDIAGVGASEASVIAAEIAATAFEGVFPIPNAGGAPYGAAINWAQFASSTFDYAQFSSPQSGLVTINNAPSIFTLDTQHYGDAHYSVQINPAGGSGELFTLILGDNTSSASLGKVFAAGYSTVDIVAAGTPFTQMTDGIEITGHLVISGTGGLGLGNTDPFSVIAQAITTNGVSLGLGTVTAHIIDASDAPYLGMSAPASPYDKAGVTVLGGTEQGGDPFQHNILQGSLGLSVKTVTFSNGSTGVVATDFVGADNITGGSGGGDAIGGAGGADTITLPNHTRSDFVIFGNEEVGINDYALAITNGSDNAYLGSWGVGTAPIAIPTLFSDAPSGGASADMTVITGFNAGSAGDLLDFRLEAWNGESSVLTSQGPLSSPRGDLVALNGVSVVPLGAAQLSAPWINSGSNSSLNATDNVLRYAPSDASLQNAQQLAAHLHTSDAVVLPGGAVISPNNNKHILVAYDASSNVNGTIQHAVNIADVDLVNMGANNQSSTANLNVYASDMVHLVGVSLSSLTPDNIHFI